MIDLDIQAFCTGDFAERIRLINHSHGPRLWSPQLAVMWNEAIQHLSLAEMDDGSVHRLRRELIALAPDTTAAEQAFSDLLGDKLRPVERPPPKLVHLILSCRKNEEKARALHGKLAGHLDPVHILVGDPGLTEAVFEGPLIIVPASDNYESLTPKILEGLVAIRQHFGPVGVLKIDDDSWLGESRLHDVQHLLKSTLYAGRVVGDSDFDRCWHAGKCEARSDEPYRGRYRGGFAGGPLYYLGREAVDLLVREYLFYGDCFSGEVFEDKAIGDALRRLDVPLTDIDLSAIFGIYNDVFAMPALHPLTYRPVDASALQAMARTRPEPAYWSDRRAYWEKFFSATQDPWQSANSYELTKLQQTLSLVPAKPNANALEVACAEGHFTAVLAPLVGSLLATDISPTAVERTAERCSGFGNVRTEVLDFSGDALPGGLDLLVCSEALYYLPKVELPAIARKFAAALNPGGYLLMAHAAIALDDREQTGFDWSHSFGVKTISEVFTASPTLQLVQELRCELYRIQLFQRRQESLIDETDAPAVTELSYADPLPWQIERYLIRGGAVMTRAEAEARETTCTVPILMYHSISDDGPAELAPYRVTPRAFEAQLRHLRRHGYHTITLNEWAEALRNRVPLRGRPLIITFDDGYKDFIANTAPIMEATDFRATVFVVTGRIGATADWDSTSSGPLPLMDWDDLRDLRRRGFDVASHTVSHADLILLSDEEIVSEGRNARAELENHLGVVSGAIAFPWGRNDDRVRAALHRAGYHVAVAAEGGRSGFDDDPMLLPRIEVFGDDDLPAFADRLLTPARPKTARALKEPRHEPQLTLPPISWPSVDPNWLSDAMKPAQVGLFAGRLQTLIETLISMQSDMLKLTSPVESVRHRLLALFNLAPTGDTPRAIKPYEPVLPELQFGFDTTASASLAVLPKTNYAASPDSCVNRLEIRFSGVSRWFTLEVTCTWAEIANAVNYQLNLCGTSDHLIACRPLLRLPQKDGASRDITLSPLTLGPTRRASTSSGELMMGDLESVDMDQKPRILLFFDCEQELSLDLDYINLYFG